MADIDSPDPQRKSERKLASQMGFELPAPAQPRSMEDGWQYVLDQIEPAQRALLKNAQPLTIHESTLMVAVPNDFTRERIETKMRSRIEELLSDFFYRETRMALTIDSGIELDLLPNISEPEEEPTEVAHFVPKAEDDRPDNLTATPSSTPTNDPDNRLNPKYTFDTFVIGSSNRFAHAAARAVAEAPGKAYSPLLIYGDSGLGKTHLLHAIGHYVRNYYDRVRVKYVSTEEMTNDFISAISENRAAEFRRTYRDVDVLLIDDIQFLSSKVQTQEEFFHTFNTLYNAEKQIVMTSDRPPKALEALEPRLRSRFEMGLITDIQPPDLETRIAILKKKAHAERLEVPHDVLEFIASKIQTNIRELEGALIRVTAFASLNRQPVDLALTESVLKDLIPDGYEQPVTAQLIMDETAKYFSITFEELISASRTRILVNARQIAMYLCRELTELSLPKIGQLFGGKDHTTVMYADRKIRRRMSEERSLYNQVTELTSIIKQCANGM